MSRAWKAVVMAALLAAVALVIVACGSSGGSSSSGNTSANEGSGAETSESEGAETSESESEGVDTAAAEKLVAPYLGHPTAFPVEEPLKERPPAGSTFAYLQCSSPFCGLFAEQLKGATKAMGVKLAVVKAGASASELQTAMSSIIAMKPAAVIVPSVEESIPKQLAELDEMGIPVGGAGIIDPEKYGVDVNFQGEPVFSEEGKVLAAWSVLREGESTNAVFYATPELSFSPVVEAGFNEALEELCSSCSTRSVTIPLSEYGNKAPSHVVSDLQANPETNVGIFASEEGAEGLSAQLKTAGLEEVAINGNGATPAILQEIASGGIAGAMGIDTNMLVWGLVDGLSRVLANQPLSPVEEKGQAPMQLLEQKDVEGVDVEHGFVAYPEGEKKFEELWSGK